MKIFLITYFPFRWDILNNFGVCPYRTVKVYSPFFVDASRTRKDPSGQSHNFSTTSSLQKKYQIIMVLCKNLTHDLKNKVVCSFSNLVSPSQYHSASCNSRSVLLNLSEDKDSCREMTYSTDALSISEIKFPFLRDRFSLPFPPYSSISRETIRTWILKLSNMLLQNQTKPNQSQN